MKYECAPLGWEYEPADPAVGIMDESWFHCGDDPAEVKMLGGTTPPGGSSMYVRFTTRLTCPSCRTTTTIERDEFCGDYESVDMGDNWA